MIAAAANVRTVLAAAIERPVDTSDRGQRMGIDGSRTARP
jgi:hypothetical protein